MIIRRQRNYSANSQKAQDQKEFSIGFRIRSARARYRDVIDDYSDPEYIKRERESAEAWLKSSQEKARFNDKERQITYPGGHKSTFKDDLRYQVAKESQQKAQAKVEKGAAKYYKEVNSNKSPKQRARREATKVLFQRSYTDSQPKRRKINLGKVKSNITKATAAMNAGFGGNSTMDAAINHTNMQMMGMI